jgi:hypothetical protein
MCVYMVYTCVYAYVQGVRVVTVVHLVDVLLPRALALVEDGVHLMVESNDYDV